MKPNFIGVGGMKCATTWISECLRAHPEVFLSNNKEVHYFSKLEYKGEKWYFNHFKNSSEYKAIGEFSTSYLDNYNVAEKIKKKLGNIKIIISLRNPIDRFLSHYKHVYRNESNHDNMNVESITLEQFNNVVKTYPELLEKGLYYNQVKKYIETFGRENVCIIIKEELDKEPQKEIQRLYKYLEIDSNYLPTIIDKKVSLGTIPKYYILEKARVKIYKIMKINAPWVIVLVRKIRLAEFYRKINSVKSDIELQKNVRSKLNEYYHMDISKLEGLIGKSLIEWK
ncbi:sulfotransferase domain-containing protein [Alteribacillus sp. HJP-4]|uniref:sulfotransferase domain-containing protein n=1 Tax=Alteribacillus sp. HJP-4 TaxID=2775394 RepID=UPI0035CCDCB3